MDVVRARGSRALATLWLPWEPGPHRPDPHREVLVSFTEFRATRFATLPGVFRAGLQLRRGWFAMDGAVGMFLWSQPWNRRGGSLSVWRDELSLARFVRLPRHVSIRRRFTGRVTVRASSWTQRIADPEVLKHTRPTFERG